MMKKDFTDFTVFTTSQADILTDVDLVLLYLVMMSVDRHDPNEYIVHIYDYVIQS